MSPERGIAEAVWQAHAEIIHIDDWALLEDAIRSEQPIDISVIEPIGDNKDGFIASLMIIYWTMKIAHEALKFMDDLSGLPRPERKRKLARKIQEILDPSTPGKVKEKVDAILEEIEKSRQ